MPTTLDGAFAQYLDAMTPEKPERESAASHRDSVRAALAGFDPYSMNEIGSLKNGTAVTRHCDSDYLLWLPGAEANGGSTALLRRICVRLKERFPQSTIYVSSPAVAAYFTGSAGTVEVVPGVLSTARDGFNVYRIPDPASNSGGWIYSSPDCHQGYVNKQNSRLGGDVKALARLLKAWKYENEVPISSFYLEMQAARHAESEPAIIYSWDLRDIFKRMMDDQLRDMNDPTGAEVGRIQPCSSNLLRGRALYNVKAAYTLAADGHRLRRANDHRGAARKFRQLFGDEFPLVS